MTSRGEGVKACEEALERLLEGSPNLAVHVGLPRHKITAGIVSVEAGFDRGYLKKSRKLHMPLIARIEHIKRQTISPTSGIDQARRSRNAHKKVERELVIAKEQLAAVLSQNLMLLNQIRELETKLEIVTVKLQRH